MNRENKRKKPGSHDDESRRGGQQQDGKNNLPRCFAGIKNKRDPREAAAL